MLRIVRNLAIFNGVVIIVIGAYAYAQAMPWSEIIALLLTSILAAVPVALLQHSPLPLRSELALWQSWRPSDPTLRCRRSRNDRCLVFG